MPSRTAAWFYVSGVSSTDPNGRIDADPSFADPVSRVLRDADAILKTAGFGPDRLLKTTVYITDVGDWGCSTGITRSGRARIARRGAVVPVPALHHGFRIEVDFIAVAGGSVSLDDEDSA